MASMWRGLDALNAPPAAPLRWSACALGALLGLAGCATPQPLFARCTTSTDCAAGLGCYGGICQMGPGSPLDRCDTDADCASVVTSPNDAVDLLFVVDNSGSMAEEQQSLITEIPRFLQALASGDLDAATPVLEWLHANQIEDIRLQDLAAQVSKGRR